MVTILIFVGCCLRGSIWIGIQEMEIVCCARSLMDPVGMAVTVENSAASARMEYMPEIAMMVRSLHPSSFFLLLFQLVPKPSNDRHMQLVDGTKQNACVEL